MTAMTNLLVYDDETTPNEFTFEPLSDDSDSSIWRTSVATVPDAGQKRFTVSQVKLKNGQWKTSAKLESPVMEVPVATGVGGYMAAPKVAHTVTTILTQFSDQRATAQDRANALRILLGLSSASTAASGSTQQAVNTLTQTFVTSTRMILRCFIALVRPN